MNPQKTTLLPEIFTKELTSDYGSFILSSLPPGFGTTIGNALRRTLFSSIGGYAITHLRIHPSVSHEFASINGVKEDIQEIILNLKKIKLKKINDTKEEKILVFLQNKNAFKGSDIAQASSSYEVVNGNDIICHLEPFVTLEIELTIAKGRGYEPAEEHKPQEQIHGFFPIDAIFSPVKNVTFNIENMLVGEKADYEKLIIDIKTNGAICPQKALKEVAGLLATIFSFVSTDPMVEKEKVSQEEVESIESKQQIEELLYTPLSKLSLSARVVNSLSNHGIEYLKDIVGKKVSDLLLLPNFGKKCLQDLEKFLKEKNIAWDMGADSLEE